MRYTAKDLQKVSNTSLQSINKLFKSNSELKELSKEHRTVENRNVFYDEVIYEWFCRRYNKKTSPLVENSVVGANFINEDGNILQYTAPSSQPQEEEANIKLKEELEKVKAECAELQARCEKLEAENKDLREQNGNILWLLTQEKLEKQKLLPQPRKSIVGRIKELFSRPSGNGNNNSPSA